MSFLDAANLLVCGLLFILAAIAWRQRGYVLVIVNVLAGVLVVGIEIADLFLPTSRVDLFFSAAAIGIVLIVDLYWTWRGDISIPEYPSSRQALCRTPLQYRPGFMITDLKRVRDELDRYPGLQKDDGAVVVKFYQKGARAFKNNRSEAAQRIFENALECAPTASGYANLAAALLAQQRYDPALMRCDAALQLDSQSFEAWMNRGLALEGLERHAEAVVCYAHGRDLQPNRQEPLLFKAQALRRINQLPAAVEACDQSLAANPGNPEAWYLKGLCQYRALHLEDAKHCFEKTVGLSPDHAPAHFGLGNVLLKMDLADDAVDSYTRALRLEPAYLEALNNRGIAFGKIGRLHESRKNYQTALRISPEYHEARLNLAVAYDVSNDKEKAVDNYKKFLEDAPSHMQEKVGLISRRVEELTSQNAQPVADAAFHPAELSVQG